MTARSNCSAPVNNRIADVTISSARISTFGTSSIFIRKRYRIMNVSGAVVCLKSNVRKSCLELSIYAELLV